MRVLLVTTVARKVSWGALGQTQTYCESVCRDRDKLETPACP